MKKIWIVIVAIALILSACQGGTDSSVAVFDGLELDSVTVDTTMMLANRNDAPFCRLHMTLVYVKGTNAQAVNDSVIHAGILVPDYFAIGQCTPGLIALNVATFIGSRRKGVAGAIAATLGFVTIPIIIILIIATFLQGFADMPVVQNAFAGIRVCVCVLIVQAVLRLWKKSVVDKVSLCLYIGVFLMTALSGVLPVAVPAAILVITSGILGVIIGGLRGKNDINKEAEKKS